MTSGVLLLVGLLLLVKSADLLVEGALELARRLGVPPLVVGLTVVSFGTSLPELVVTFIAAQQGDADLAISNIVGSNVANVLLILGCAAMIRPLPVKDSTVVSEIPFSLAAALLLGFLANAALFSDMPRLSISRLDGLILLFFFVLFMIYTYKTSLAGRSEFMPDAARMSGTRVAVYLVLGVAGLYLGGQFVVRSAIAFAAKLGVTDSLIGLTVVAIGTSIPELVTSCVAAYRRQPDIAVGNVVGSNIFNVLGVLGVTAACVELPFEAVTNTDLVAVIFSSALILVSMAVSRSSSILRWHGAVYVTLYVAFIVSAVMRQ